jgi:FAD/FMN-containing dehydrogenase
MPDLLTELRECLGDEAVLDSVALASRARNYWDSTPLQARALVRPRSTAELSRVMTLCHSRAQSVVVHGGLTGVCDADRATGDDVVVSFERMMAIEEIDPVGRTVTVQAGCRLEELQKAVEQQNLYFPLDLGARGSCTIGGNVATNAGGINVIRFGMMRALVLGLEVVLPDGTIISSMNHMLKNNSGYDVKQLFIGSEGTLGIIARIVLTLKERSLSVNTILAAVGDGEKLAPLLKLMDQRLGGTLSSFEAMWGDYYRAVTAPGWHQAPIDRQHDFYVIVEAQGPDQTDDARRFTGAVEEAYNAGLIVDAIVPKSGKERAQLWSIREDFDALRQLSPLFLYDISLQIRDMLPYVDEVRRSLLKRWPASQFFALGHIGDGNLHFFVAPCTAGDSAAQHAVCDELVYQPLGRLSGAVSAEHGIGLEKKAWLSVSRTQAELDLMRLLKRTLDRKNILNPGKVIEV